jgi:hypothetical protein
MTDGTSHVPCIETLLHRISIHQACIHSIPYPDWDRNTPPLPLSRDDFLRRIVLLTVNLSSLPLHKANKEGGKGVSGSGLERSG